MVGPVSEEFSLEVHHGGFFVGKGENRVYIDEKIDWFDQCDRDTWSPLWIDDFIGQLGYKKTDTLMVYWLLPAKNLTDGLRVTVSDGDTNVIASIVDRVKNLVIYLHHDNNIHGIDWDNIVVNPVASMPKEGHLCGEECGEGGRNYQIFIAI